MGAMIPVAESRGVKIFCPQSGRYSFYNSPYPAHRLMTGIDVYPNTASSSVAPSPVDGEISQVRRVKAPNGRGFDAPEYDTVTLVKAKDQDAVIKILHVDTELECGRTIKAGEPLGPLIRSGYFGYQTPLHAHVEVRPGNDPLRVRGGYPMNSLLSLKQLRITEDVSGTIVLTRKGYAQVQLRGSNPWVVLDIGGEPGIIDGGIPIYGWFGAHVEASKRGAPVKLLEKQIGVVTNARPRTCVADCAAFEAKIGSTPVDLFFVLQPSDRSIITATSKKRGELDLDEGEDVSITLA